MFRSARERLTKKRGSCARCPNPPLPGKKLCQKCSDELQSRRDAALASGTCLKCFKKPAEPGLQVCSNCAKIKTDVEKLRRVTNPETEKERIRQRDKEYRKTHGTERRAYINAKRQKDRAAKIGWDIEEANNFRRFKENMFGTFEDESFKNKSVIDQILNIAIEIDDYTEQSDATDNQPWHIRYITFRKNNIKLLQRTLTGGLGHGWYALLWDDESIYIVQSTGTKMINNLGSAKHPKAPKLENVPSLLNNPEISDEYLNFWLSKALGRFKARNTR
jgi:hypothetical protein